MKIPYKAAYALIDRYYLRVSSLKQFIQERIPRDIFKASLLFAKKQEDYRYLSVMVSEQEEYDQNHILFLKFNPEFCPLVLLKDVDLTLFEFAIICKKSDIPVEEFKMVVEACAENILLDSKEQIEAFQKILDLPYVSVLA